LLVEGDDLAVEHRRVVDEAAQLAQLGVAVCQGFVVAALDSQPIIRHGGDVPDTVPLELIRPIRALGPAGGGEHRRDPGR
jgi:hypothetical protein